MAKVMTPAMEKIAQAEKKRAKKGKSQTIKKYSMAAEVIHRMTYNSLAMVGLGIFIVLVLCALFPQFIAPEGYDDQNYARAFIAPCWEFPLGTDSFGRDILSRVIWGARTSLCIGVVSVAFSVLVGGAIGAVAAYYGGKLDNVLMRIMDVLMAIPSFLLCIAVTAAFGSGFLVIVCAIAIGNVPSYSRIVRAAVLTIKDSEFVEAARSIGASDFRITMKHLIPNCLSPIIVQATMGVAGAILSAAGLSFMGLGIQPPTPEWGYMLNAGKQYIRDAWWIVTFPGVTIMAAIFSLNLLGDGLRDALDPKLKK